MLHDRNIFCFKKNFADFGIRIHYIQWFFFFSFWMLQAFVTCFSDTPFSICIKTHFAVSVCISLMYYYKIDIVVCLLDCLLRLWSKVNTNKLSFFLHVQNAKDSTLHYCHVVCQSQNTPRRDSTISVPQPVCQAYTLFGLELIIIIIKDAYVTSLP